MVVLYLNVILLTLVFSCRESVSVLPEHLLSLPTLLPILFRLCKPQPSVHPVHTEPHSSGNGIQMPASAFSPMICRSRTVQPRHRMNRRKPGYSLLSCSQNSNAAKYAPSDSQASIGIDISNSGLWGIRRDRQCQNSCCAKSDGSLLSSSVPLPAFSVLLYSRRLHDSAVRSCRC